MIAAIAWWVPLAFGLVWGAIGGLFLAGVIVGQRVAHLEELLRQARRHVGWPPWSDSDRRRVQALRDRIDAYFSEEVGPLDH